MALHSYRVSKTRGQCFEICFWGKGVGGGQNGARYDRKRFITSACHLQVHECKLHTQNRFTSEVIEVSTHNVCQYQEQVIGTYVYSQKHNYIPYSTFTITTVQLHVSAINVGHL